MLCSAMVVSASARSLIATRGLAGSEKDRESGVGRLLILEDSAGTVPQRDPVLVREGGAEQRDETENDEAVPFQAGH